MNIDSKAESTNTQKKYQGPKAAEEPGSTIVNRGAAQEVPTSSNSAPKGKVGAPNPKVLHLNYM